MEVALDSLFSSKESCVLFQQLERVPLLIRISNKWTNHGPENQSQSTLWRTAERPAGEGYRAPVGGGVSVAEFAEMAPASHVIWLLLYHVNICSVAITLTLHLAGHPEWVWELLDNSSRTGSISGAVLWHAGKGKKHSVGWSGLPEWGSPPPPPGCLCNHPWRVSGADPGPGSHRICREKKTSWLTRGHRGTSQDQIVMLLFYHINRVRERLCYLKHLGFDLVRTMWAKSTGTFTPNFSVHLATWELYNRQWPIR